ncbi:ribosome biogenesis GTPase Der [Limnochorda pilosa]|uniref:Multifunctional fusion protein n=1 Tax=Limnochorda pilosa TaxID=1555112 RepID=A0A0K2SKJ8_LIMPI|nr:ribosome biogenesis GTPase Der [Limnochorda pilosa]BAS27620.1 ribosome-associated GTPase EngA [Limnochorda pilosa]
MKGLPRVAIVGRPNVGKSTLFNRMARRRAALVHDEPGVTRDPLEAEVEWAGRRFVVVDTGGYDPRGEAPVAVQVVGKVHEAIARADVLVLVVDAQQGLTGLDAEAAEQARRAGRRVLVAANKVDDPARSDLAAEFYRLGLGDPVALSAEHGRGVGDLLDAIVARLPEGVEPPPDQGLEPVRVAVIGRPNVGKSSLINRLLGYERLITSPEAGTTRDVVDSRCRHEGRDFVLLDTAGIRRRSRVLAGTGGDLERVSVSKALASLKRAHVALLLIDAMEGFTDQDRRLVRQVEQVGCGLVLVVNKWDLVEKQTGTLERYEKGVRSAYPLLEWVPMVFASAATGQRVRQALTAAGYVYEQAGMRVPTATLNASLQAAAALRQPPSHKGRRLKILYGTQVAIRPPQIVLFVNDPDLVHFSYQRFLERHLRAQFGFAGSPMRLIVRAREGWDRRGAPAGPAAPPRPTRPQGGITMAESPGRSRWTVAVIGAGSWGTALAMHLADRGTAPLLWARRPERAGEIARLRENTPYLPGITLSPLIHVTSDLEEALEPPILLLALPAQTVRAWAERARGWIRPEHVVVHGSKGLEVGTLLRVSQVLRQVLPDHPEGRILTLSGPNHAEEVVRGVPSTSVLAGGDPDVQARVQQLLMDRRLRVYTSDDLVGVELGGALKNVIALGCGISDGLGYGDNTRAALITRGLAEIRRLGAQMGAHPFTFSGLSGLGDLVATATSLHSRNLRAGRAIGAGRRPSEVLREGPMVVEGAPTAHAAVRLGEQRGVELPIATAVHRVLSEEITPREAVDSLMGRDPRGELEALDLAGPKDDL